jgi:hypothetical protein
MKPPLPYLLMLCFVTASALAVPVTFRVDMSGATGFNSVLDVVDVRGTFNGWSGGSNLISTANPNILTNTFEIGDPAGTVEHHKFTWNSNFELQGIGDRPFTLGSTAQTLPLVYFSDLPPAISATTNSITFRVSMSAQVTVGNFDPTNDTVSVAGTFQRPAQWTSQIFQLTNSGGNLYIGTFTNDGNYPGTYEEFKFIITHFGNDTWEYINNRTFILTNNGVLPIVYFNDIGNATPVTFQVDMSVQAAGGRFVNGADVVECKGSFNGWLGGFVLTNDPAINSNLFKGTLFIFENPGTTEYYRFTVNGGFSGLGWETPASTDGTNRSFMVTTNALTLPVVLWSDWTSSDLLPAMTVVTFQVNMTNAVGADAHVFDSNFDTVYLNGDWIPWWSWNSPPPEFQMTNNPVGSEIYTISLAFPPGFSVPLTYKYSINGGDNEAGFGINHLRYVRSTGVYSLPMDTFGSQLHEQSFGNLQMGKPTAGKSLISWLGRPGVWLQKNTNLTSTSWQNLPATDGLSSTNYPISAAREFFRLVKP